MKRLLLSFAAPAALAALAAVIVGCADVAVEESEESEESSAEASDCTRDPNRLVNLNDACKRKVQPSNRERSLSCPVVATEAAGFVTSAERAEIDTHAFDRVAPFDPKNPVRIAGIVIRRVDGVPHYRYVSNGRHDEVVQPWSSSKWIGVLAAGATLRAKSSGAVGLTASVGGKPLGDLVTDIETYENRVASSNGLARWFKNVAGRDVAQSLVTDWLGRSGEEFRGGYGPDLAKPGYELVEAGGASIKVTPDDRSGITNVLSMMTEAEALKRLAVWDDEATRPPGLEAADAETVLYGAAKSVAYRDEAGGMMRDPAIYVQNALDLPALEREGQGRWRIFSKLGNGEATRAGLGYVSEIAHVAYACLPALDADGEPIPNEGAEFVVAIHSTNKNARANDAALDGLYRRVVNEVMRAR